MWKIVDDVETFHYRWNASEKYVQLRKVDWMNILTIWVTYIQNSYSVEIFYYKPKLHWKLFSRNIFQVRKFLIFPHRTLWYLEDMFDNNQLLLTMYWFLTSLQKNFSIIISEVHSQCEYLTIFPPLRFYVKLIMVNLNRQ